MLRRLRRKGAPGYAERFPPPSDAVKVGNKEGTLAEVRGAHACKRINKRWEDFISFNFHLRKHSLDRQTVFKSKDSRRILCHDPSGKNRANDSKHLRPEPSVICSASTLSSNGRRLARWAAGNKVNCAKVSVWEGVDICASVDAGPVTGKDGKAIGVSLNLRDGRESCPLCGKVDSPDAGE